MFREAAQVLLTLLRCISMKTALAGEPSNHLNFFRLYDACLMDVAVVSWCKMFGSERNNDLYWTRLRPPSSTQERQSLEKELTEASGGNLASLSTLIRNYRDTYVAHHDLDVAKRASQHPDLVPLQMTGQVLYRHVHRSLDLHGQAAGLPSPDSVTGTGLRRIEAEWKKIAAAARAATGHLVEP
jgi:hypothetical protein